MTPYGKTAEYAVAAVSLLAQVYHEKKKLSSQEIAESRELPKPVVAKVLTILSQAGIVTGSPGPGGGYSLAKPPESIKLMDIAECFDRKESTLSCPFGPNHCGRGNPCPLHHQLAAIRDRLTQFLQNNTLAVFTTAASESRSSTLQQVQLLGAPA
jgi:Rrf2 family transcriptional regulator, iron-sulfur cluster assembly transcription factor